MKEITSVQNPLIKHLVKLRHNRDYRYDHHSVVIDGSKMVREVGKSYAPKVIVCLDPEEIPKEVAAKEVILVDEKVMAKISGMNSPEGIIAEVAMPLPAELRKMEKFIVMDGINDPGNVGALIRSALAFGWDGAYIIEESCDPYNDKALRAAKGATFRLPIAWGTWEQLQMGIKGKDIKPLVADLGGTSLNALKVKGNIMLVFGNESHGPSKFAKELCKGVTIPMSGDMESLNVGVAGGILMYELNK